MLYAQVSESVVKLMKQELNNLMTSYLLANSTLVLADYKYKEDSPWRSFVRK